MDRNALALVNGEGKGNPPPTDEFYPEKAILRVNLLDVLRLGIAIGLACVVLFLFSVLMSAFNGGTGFVVDFIELLYPGLVPGLLSAVIAGAALSFFYGVVFGLVLGAAYNVLIKGYLDENENYERFS